MKQDVILIQVNTLTDSPHGSAVKEYIITVQPLGGRVQRYTALTEAQLKQYLAATLAGIVKGEA